MGQICREGMNESGILPKARYAMTIFYLPGVAGCLGEGRYKPPEAPAILQYTVPKNAPSFEKISHFFFIFTKNILVSFGFF